MTGVRADADAGPEPAAPRREFDLVVLGATGLTGRLVAAHLAALSAAGHVEAGRWAVAGRDRDRVAAVARDLGVDAPVVVADTTDRASLRTLATRTTVLLNVAGPYTDTAADVIAACVAAGTSYVDLSGELPLLQRVVRRFDQPARRAGVAVVQMAGWEALPADLATLAACRAAAGAADDADGPGLNAPIDAVDLTFRFQRRPAPASGPRGTAGVSGGTLASVVAMLADPDARVIGDQAGLLPPVEPGRRHPAVGPLRLRPRRRDDRVTGPVVPVAFLDPPILHRTAALLARERGDEHRPAAVRESLDLGPATGRGAWGRWARAGSRAALQRLAVDVARLPGPVRTGLCRVLRRSRPPPGSGPSGRQLHDWAWSVTAEAVSDTGRRAGATLTGTGHPGYTATAAMIIEVGLRLAHGAPARTGCLTPALVLGARHRFTSPTLQLTHT